MGSADEHHQTKWEPGPVFCQQLCKFSIAAAVLTRIGEFGINTEPGPMLGLGVYFCCRVYRKAVVQSSHLFLLLVQSLTLPSSTSTSMNAIFAVAFFAACVAAQTFDTTTTTDLNRLLLKNKLSTTADLFRSSGLYGKQHYGGIQSYDRLATPWVLPQQSYYNQQYNSRQGVVGDFDGVVYTLDEIVRHPLFRQYLTLPLFRQHLSHPLFQYYLTTPLFQQYWTIPQFQTLFRNPYLFYKYIYPVVYSTESTVFDQVKTDSLYPYNSVDNVDTSIFGTQRRTAGSFLDTLVNKQVVYPSIYGQSQNNHYGSIFPRHHLPYTYVMDKIFRNLFINKPQITEVVTDVKVQPTGQIDEQTFGKYVDPVTGQVKYTTGDINVVDEKIVPDFDDQIFGRKQSNYNYYNTKDALLKRLYLNKMLYGGDRKIDQQLYPEFSTETVRDQQTIPIMDKINKLHRFDNILDKININGVVDNYNKYNVDNVDELIRTPVVDSDLLFNLRHKDLLRTVPLSKDLVKDFTLDSKYNDLKTMLLDNKPTITTKTVVV